MWHATSAPRGKSCTVSNCHVAKTMPNQLNSEARDLFQTNFFFTGTKIKTDLNYKNNYHI